MPRNTKIEVKTPRRFIKGNGIIGGEFDKYSQNSSTKNKNINVPLVNVHSLACH